MSSNKFFVKDYLQYNHWVGHSVIMNAGAVVFQKIKAMREGGNKCSESF